MFTIVLYALYILLNKAIKQGLPGYRTRKTKSHDLHILSGRKERITDFFLTLGMVLIGAAILDFFFFKNRSRVFTAPHFSRP